jgi:flagellin-like protein
MKRLRSNRKAVSPVISVLLMIAVAVAASLITYAWVMGYLGGTTSKVGRAIQIQSMYYNTTAGTLTVYVQNVGTGAVTLSSVYENGQNATGTVFNPATLLVNQTSTVTTNLPAGFSPVNAVDVKVVCSDGTFIEATQIVPGS